ncbi:DegT/DnrJ/EryC1/StrS aminotransferase family protein [Aquibium microcysteis]|uniref:DegT/DnrJ/EryC1/StrS aminotransferase family protein n=1 Tax=Aquibium microcysteis TaxID=675281 RepID=UPI00165D00CF|nr:DegT/DnrJ/EryC1/StrS aminotransferase family protein [Aquibium microcysteis]
MGFRRSRMRFGRGPGDQPARERDLAAIRAVWLSGCAALYPLSQVSHAFPLVAACARAQMRRRPVFWIPEFFCDEALDLLRDGTAAIVAYPLTPDLEPDWPACAELAVVSPPDVLVLVHFFGRAGPAAEARLFCDGRGALLVEDATQILQPVQGIGQWGDFLLFGPHKFFDIPDGGLLVVRDPADCAPVESALLASAGGHPDPTRWRLKRWERLLRRHLPHLHVGRRPPVRRLPGTARATIFREPNVSPYALRRLAGFVGSGRTRLIAQRRLLFERWLRTLLAPLPGAALVEPHPDATPCWFSVSCADEPTQRAAIAALQAQGLHAQAWPNHLPPEALAGRRRRAVIALRNRYLIVAPPRA